MSEDVRLSARDRIACALANGALRLASPWYRAFVSGAIQYGMRAAARDADEGREPPGDWWEGR